MAGYLTTLTVSFASKPRAAAPTAFEKFYVERVFPILGVLVTLVTYLFLPSDNVIFLLPVGMLWFWLLCFFGSRRKLSAIRMIAAASTPLFCMLAFAIGNNNALRDVSNTEFKTVLKLNDEMTKVVLFRFFENGVLYRREADRKIVFSTWEHISEIAAEDVRPNQRRRICDFLPLCFEKPPVSITK